MNPLACQNTTAAPPCRQGRADTPKPVRDAMGICVLAVAIATMLRCADLHAQTQTVASSPLLNPSSGDTVSKVNFDADASAAFMGTGHAHQKNQKWSYEEVDSALSLLSTFQTSSNSPVWRVGLDWERFWFSPGPAATVPSALESLNLRLGADLQLSPAIFMRIEALPGFYGQGLNQFSGGRQFNVPVEIGASYVYSDRLYFILGAEINYEFDFPVFPAFGLLWRVNDKLTINGIAPKPEIEYKLTDNLTLHAGAEFSENAYRVNGDFGRIRGVAKLDNAIVEFSEIRIGGGMTWKVNKTFSFDLEAGAVPYRNFNYYRADDYKVKSTNTVPYLAVGFSAKF